MSQPTLFDCPATPSEQREPRTGAPRTQTPQRKQLEWGIVSVDELVPEDHRARAVWEFVDRLDLSSLYGQIQAREAQPGRPAIDPKILMALWILGTADGIGSARELARLCREHAAYRWICGGVSLEYHSLSDFRANNRDAFRKVLINSVAVLLQQGLVDFDCVAQDGVRVRASAGAASFRRRETLEQCLREAQARVEALEADGGEATARERAARRRAARERIERVAEALRQLPEVEAIKERNRRAGDEVTKKNAARVSTTDPDVRVMKMADGGFRPAYNLQFATTVNEQVVVGVAITNSGVDQGQMPPMIDQIQADHGQVPAKILVDGGFAKIADIEDATAQGTTVYAPVQTPKDKTRDPHTPREGDSAAIADWRVRMGTDEAKEIYKQRAATAECVNAQARAHGLTQLLVRGTEKVLAVGCLIGITNNFMRWLCLTG
jgi:transposase